ncbi:EAL domain-containing protein [Persephonella sp.]
MISLSFLSHYIDPIVDEYKKEILKDRNLSKFFYSNEELDKVSSKIKSFLKESFAQDDEEKVKKRFYKLGIFHASKKIPFVNVVSGLNYLKNKIYKKIFEDEQLKLLVPFLNSFFDTAINYLSKGYLHYNIDVLINEYKTFDIWQHKDYKRDLINWSLSISRYVKGDLKEIPELDPEKSELSKILNSFDFRVKCPDENIYNQILEIHRNVHNYARSLIYYNNSHRYMEAYFIYKTFLAETYRLLNDIDTVYFLFEINKENIFFKFILRKTKEETPYITIINIRNLKIINKFYGTDAGDKILEVITKTLENMLDPTQNIFIKGYSGDFYILHRYKPKDPYSFGKFLKKSLENIVIKNGFDLKFKVTVAIIEIKDILDKKELRKILNHAIQKSKNSPEEVIFIDKKQVKEQFFSEIHDVYKNVSIVEKAFKENKIDVFFQPIVDLSTGNIKHLEALARIKENGNYIPAGAFIDLIYDMHLIKELDIAVLRRVYEYKNLLKKITNKIFLNISAISISSPDFIKEFIEKMNKIKKEGVDTIIELTEQSFLESIDLIKFMRNEYGFVFAVDDFGTGYSSIRTVYDLSEIDAIRYLKIDGSLIRNIDKSEKNIKPVETIVSFAKTLGLATIAEFVENESIANKLREISIDYGQGYFFYKPMSINNIIKVINNAK